MNSFGVLHEPKFQVGAKVTNKDNGRKGYVSETDYRTGRARVRWVFEKDGRVVKLGGNWGRGKYGRLTWVNQDNLSHGW